MMVHMKELLMFADVGHQKCSSEAQSLKSQGQALFAAAPAGNLHYPHLSPGIVGELCCRRHSGCSGRVAGVHRTWPPV